MNLFTFVVRKSIKWQEIKSISIYRVPNVINRSFIDTIKSSYLCENDPNLAGRFSTNTFSSPKFTPEEINKFLNSSSNAMGIHRISLYIPYTTVFLGRN